eukprot:gene11206-7779_t
MTQQHLRRCTALHALLFVTAILAMYFYCERAAFQYIQYVFNSEMLRRVTYVSALAEWIPLSELMSAASAGLIDFSDTTGFLVQITAAISPDPSNPHATGAAVEINGVVQTVTDLAISSGFPITAYRYSKALNGVISVKDAQLTDFHTGFLEEALSISVCCAFSVPMVMFLCLSAANLLARSGRWLLSRLTIWAGYLLFPCAMGVVMLAVLAKVQQGAQENAWKVDLLRSALLYGEMFTAVHNLLSTSTAQSLAKTLERVNNELYMDQHYYQVVVAIGPEQTVSPPMWHANVHETIFGSARTKPLVPYGMVDGVFYGTSSLPRSESLLVCLRENEPAPSILSDLYRPALVVLLCTMGGLSFLLLAFRFPFGALGLSSTSPALPLSFGLWDFRLPKLWPYIKLLEIAAFLAVLLIALVDAMGRVSQHFARTGTLKAYYLDRLRVLEDVAEVGDLIVMCYAGVLKGADWTLDYLRMSSKELTNDESLLMGEFYSRLTRLLKEQHYFMYSCGNLLSSQPLTTWPLLENVATIRYFLQRGVSSHADITFYHWVVRYDNDFLRAIMTSDPEFLSKGNPSLEAELRQSLVAIGSPELTVEDLDQALQVCLLSYAPYYNIAAAYAKEDVSTRPFVDLYGSDLGRVAVTVEEDVMIHEQMRIEPSVFIDLSYAWRAFPSLYLVYIFVVLFMLYIAWDVFYSVHFFVGVNWGALFILGGQYVKAPVDSRPSRAGERGSRTNHNITHYRKGDAACPQKVHGATPETGGEVSASIPLGTVQVTRPRARGTSGKVGRDPTRCVQGLPPPGSGGQETVTPLGRTTAPRLDTEQTEVVLLPLHDYTAPKSKGVVCMHQVRYALLGFAMCDICMLLFTLVVCVVVHAHSISNVTMVDEETTYFQQSMIPLSRQTGDAAQISMSLAAWARAYLSLHGDAILRAIALTSLWTDMKPITYADGGKPDHAATRVSSTVLREVLRVALNASTQTALMLEENRIDGVYADFAVLLEMYDTYFHFNGYMTCIPAASQLDYEESLTALLRALLVSANHETYETITGPLMEFLKPCEGRGAPADLQAYLRRLEELDRKSFQVFDHNELSSLFSQVKGDVSNQVQEMFGTMSHQFNTLKTESNLSVPWIVVIYTWLMSLLVYSAFRNAQHIHAGIYNS